MTSTAAWRRFLFLWFWCLVLGAVAPGCSAHQSSLPAVPEPKFALNDEAKRLDFDQQSQISAILDEKCGPPLEPRLLGGDHVTASQLDRGRTLFLQFCAACHGVVGNGAGVMAELMTPRPRDFRRAVFKFQSTPYGARPLRVDLVRTIVRGLPGSMMPGFQQFSPAELDAVADYLLTLTRRGELERELALESAVGGELTSDLVDKTVDDILYFWNEAEGQVVQPLSPQPAFTDDRIARGRDAFIARGCSKCHGDDGKGQTAENLRGGLKDYWGHTIRAADLTSGRLKGGREPLDVYRRILGGINGTPMPSFKATLWTEPESIWDLTAYVLSLGRHL